METTTRINSRVIIDVVTNEYLYGRWFDGINAWFPGRWNVEGKLHDGALMSSLDIKWKPQYCFLCVSLYWDCVSKNNVKKTRNAGRWTEARYRSFITSALRSAFRRWPPKFDVLKDACTGVKTNEASGRQAKHYRCAKCEKDFPQKQVQVDHKDPIGTCKTWDKFIARLFCEGTNLQVLCKTCHKAKTKGER